MKLCEIKNKIQVISNVIERKCYGSYWVRDTLEICELIIDLLEVKKALIRLYKTIENLAKQSKHKNIILMYENGATELEMLAQNSVSRRTIYRAINQFQKCQPSIENLSTISVKNRQFVNHLLKKS